MKNEIQYLSLQGHEIRNYIEEIASLRIEIFREWPYLYDGDFDYEKKYLSRYSEAKNSFIVIVKKNDKCIGASSCIHLDEEKEKNIREAFQKQGYDPKEVVYFGESILKKEYRGLGIGSEFMKRREDFAKSIPKTNLIGFCSVLRTETHPLRPKDHIHHDSFWMKKGFQKKEGMTCILSWKDLDEDQETEKELQFWLKRI